jgi:type IV pilus assembly protein PilM
MALPFFEKSVLRAPDQMLAVDLGTRATKAVYVQRRGQGYALSGYALLDAPIYEKNLSVEMLTEHLKAVNQGFGGRGKAVTLTVGVGDALVRTVEMPPLSIEDMRLVLKHNSKTYLQQELPNFLFDCHVVGIVDNAKAAAPAAAGKEAAAGKKQKVLVAGSRKQIIDDFVTSAKGAGLAPNSVVPGLVGPTNAFELALPQVFKESVVALVDIGFKHSAICILQNGELVLSRTVAIGGDRLTASISESMNISYAEAEGIKVGMAQEVQSILDGTITPLVRELRASIDFYEHQHEKAVQQIYVSGGSARSQVILQSLQQQLMLECIAWNPAAAFQMELPPEQVAELEQVGPQLAVALGAALSVL